MILESLILEWRKQIYIFYLSSPVVKKFIIKVNKWSLHGSNSDSYIY